MQQNEQSGVPHAIYYTLAVAVVLCVLFIGFHDEVVYVLLSFKLFEIEITQLLTSQLNYLADWIRKTPEEAVTSHDLYTVSVAVGSVIRWLSLPVALIAVILLWKFHPGNKLSTIHNMKSLLGAMKNEFPETGPIISQQLENQAIHQGAWKMALTPVEFMKEHKLLEGNKSVDHGRAQEVFIQQLGKVWQGEDELTNIEKAIFGILAAFACYERKSADTAAREISASALQKDSLKMSQALQLFNSYREKDNIKEIINKHHYVYTIFSSLLEAARQSGTVSTASFLWLKPYDRQLWYCLNNVGRQAVFVEAAAVRAHWLAEKSLMRPIETPMVKKAVDGLDLVFKTVEVENA